MLTVRHAIVYPRLHPVPAPVSPLNTIEMNCSILQHSMHSMSLMSKLDILYSIPLHRQWITDRTLYCQPIFQVATYSISTEDLLDWYYTPSPSKIM
jgi:hypothetical protein